MSRPTVLFVDDEPNLLMGLRRMTRPFIKEWDIHFAEGGAQALNILESSEINTLVTDMRMPGIGGAELLEKVSEKWPGTFCLALSGDADVVQASRIVGRSHRFLSKPCDPQMLYEAIQYPFTLRAELEVDAFNRQNSLLDRVRAYPGSQDRVSEAVDHLGANVTDAAEAISADPSLSLRLLQIVNSAYFGKPLATLDVNRAVGLVGVDRISQLLVQGRLGKEMSGDGQTRHTRSELIQAANLAKDLAARAGSNDEAQLVAYCTVFFSELASSSHALANTSGRDRFSLVYLTALLGLPRVLTDSLRVFIAQCHGNESVEELAKIAAPAAVSSQFSLAKL